MYRELPLMTAGRQRSKHVWKVKYKARQMAPSV